MKQVVYSVIPLLLFMLGCEMHERGESSVTVGSTVLRYLATVTPSPEYPRSSASAGTQGRAVVSVSYDASGVPVEVTLLESPDADIGAAVSAALHQWRFRPHPPINGRIPARTTGRLVFYFAQKNGLATVTDAANSTLAQELPNQ